MGIGEEHHHPGAAGRGHVPHFDFGGKRRQHEIHELRHSTRRAGLAREMPDMSTLIPMLMVSGVLVFTVWWAAFNDTSDQNKEDHKRARR